MEFYLNKSYIILILLLINFTVCEYEPQVLSFHPESTLLKRLNREINLINMNLSLTDLAFPDLIQYKDDKILEGASLNVTNIKLGIAEFHFNKAIDSCLDNTIKLIGGKDSGEFDFEADVTILLKNGSTVKGNATFNVNGKNLVLTKEFGYADNKPKVSAQIHLDFDLALFDTNLEQAEMRTLLGSGLIQYIIDSITGLINSKMQSSMNIFYDLYPNSLYINTSTHMPQKSINMNLNYIELPQSQVDSQTQKCSLTFKRSGKVSEISTSHAPAKFSNFNYTKDSAQIFMSKNIFDDIVNYMTTKYNFQGTINNVLAELNFFPYNLNMRFFSRILPSILNSYSPSQNIEIHWAIFGVRLSFNVPSQTITGTARLDTTFFTDHKTPHIKQIYSFETQLSFNVELLTELNKVNFQINNVDVGRTKIRENYGYSNIGQLNNWIRQTLQILLINNPYTLFETPLDLSMYYDDNISFQVVEGGILLH